MKQTLIFRQHYHHGRKAALCEGSPRKGFPEQSALGTGHPRGSANAGKDVDFLVFDQDLQQPTQRGGWSSLSKDYLGICIIIVLLAGFHDPAGSIMAQMKGLCIYIGK